MGGMLQEMRKRAGKGLKMSDSFLRRFRETNVARATEDFCDYDAPAANLFFAVGMAGEAGELLNLIKKLERRAHGGPDVGNSVKVEDISKEKLEEEFGGMLTYMDLLASHYNIDLQEAITKTFNNVSAKINSQHRL